jgi:hypothetical protein
MSKGKEFVDRFPNMFVQDKDFWAREMDEHFSQDKTELVANAIRIAIYKDECDLLPLNKLPTTYISMAMNFLTKWQEEKL